MKLRIITLISYIVYCFLIIQISFSQSGKEKAAEKAKDSISQNSNINMDAFLSSTSGKIIFSMLGILLVYIFLNLIFKKFIIPRVAKSNLKRYVPVLKIVFWVIMIGMILVFILKPTAQVSIVIGLSIVIAVGFASQDLLKNVFAGIMILFDKQFQVGDTIQIGHHSGEISQIGLKNIKLVTPEKSQITIPNSEFIKRTKSISTSKELYSQVTTELYLPPKIDLVKVKAIADRAALTSRYIYLNKPVETNIKNEIHQNQSIIKLVLKAYVLNRKYESQFSSELTEIIMDELIRQNVISQQELSFS